jgi:hypothetical protein
MVQPREQGDLPENPLGSNADGKLGMEDLEGHPLAGTVHRQEHPARASPSHFPFDRIPVLQRLLNQGQ